jgi:hypothetical protein
LRPWWQPARGLGEAGADRSGVLKGRLVGGTAGTIEATTKRVDSLANAALGMMTGASLAVAMIGKSLAQARGLLTKHSVKQVDRLLSNPKIAAVSAAWVPEMVGPLKDIVVAMD